MNTESLPPLHPAEHRLLEIMLERRLSNEEAHEALKQAILLAAYSAWINDLIERNVQ